MCTSAEVLFFSWLKAKKQLQQQKLLFLNNILVILIFVSRLFKNKGQFLYSHLGILLLLDLYGNCCLGCLVLFPNYLLNVSSSFWNQLLLFSFW